MKKYLAGLIAVLGFTLGYTMIQVPQVQAQSLNAQIQQFWNTLRTGGYSFSTLHLLAGAYENFGTTTGTLGYGIRDAAGTLQFKNSGGSWTGITGAITGGTCTNQVVTAIAASTGSPTCTTLTATYVNSSIATVATANAFTAAQTATLTALGSTSTDGLALLNGTATSGGDTVEISPRLRICGNAWNSSGSASETDCFKIETLPATVAGPTTSTLVLGSSIAGGAYATPFLLTSGGNLTILGSYIAGNNAQIAAASAFAFGATGSGRSRITSTADKLLNVLDTSAATGFQINDGTPTLGTCTGGSLVSGSHNFGGEITGNTSGSCILNFGTPNFTNTPFCTLNDETSLVAARVSARSASSITITGLTSGDAVQYMCVGRIGT